MSELARERDRVLRKRNAQTRARRRQIQARELLAATSWVAAPTELLAAVKEIESIEAADRKAVVAWAIWLQTHDARGRRLRPEEVEMARPAIDGAARLKMREYVAKRREDDPNVKAAVVHAELMQKFGVEFSLNNFYTHYWGGRDGERLEQLNEKTRVKRAGREAPEPRTPPAAPADSKTAAPAAAAPAEPAAPAKPASAKPAEEVPGPFLTLAPLADGSVLVRFVLATDPAGAAVFAQLIGQGLSIINRKAAA